MPNCKENPTSSRCPCACIGNTVNDPSPLNRGTVIGGYRNKDCVLSVTFETKNGVTSICYVNPFFHKTYSYPTPNYTENMDCSLYSNYCSAEAFPSNFTSLKETFDNEIRSSIESKVQWKPLVNSNYYQIIVTQNKKSNKSK